MKTLRVGRWVTFLLATSLAMSVSGVANASRSHKILPPHVPASNWRIPANTPLLALINGARAAQEGLSPLSLNITRYNRLTIPEQMFVITNLERVSRGEVPAYGLMAKLNQVANVGARLQRDPLPPASWGFFQSVWAGGMSLRTQAAFYSDFAWMYEDGPAPYYGGIHNIDCPVKTAAGCWGHRSAVIELYPDVSFAGPPLTLVAGASGGAANTRYVTSSAMIFVWVPGVPASGITYTWVRAVKFLGLPARYVPSPVTTTVQDSTTVPDSTIIVQG